MAVAFSIGVRRSSDQALNHKADQENGFWLPGEDDRTLILIHGLTGTPNELKFLANFFNRKGYTVVCPRLANHGRPMDILKTTTWQACYQSVREAYVKIQAKGRSGPVFTAGLSMGALLALLLAEEFPDEIAGVSCLSPTFFYDGWNMPWYRHVLFPLCCLTPLRQFFYFKEEPPYGIKNAAIRQRVHHYYSRATLHDVDGVAKHGYPYIPATLLYQLHLCVRHLRPRLPLIRVPVQLIQAQHDDMTSVKNSLFIYRKVGSQMKELELLQNSYHVVTADQEREVVAQKMLEFFTRLQGGATTTPADACPSGDDALLAS